MKTFIWRNLKLFFFFSKYQVHLIPTCKNQISFRNWLAPRISLVNLTYGRKKKELQALTWLSWNSNVKYFPRWYWILTQTEGGGGAVAPLLLGNFEFWNQIITIIIVDCYQKTGLLRYNCWHWMKLIPFLVTIACF